MELVPSVRVSILADSISSALDGSRGDACFTKAAGGSGRQRRRRRASGSEPVPAGARPWVAVWYLRPPQGGRRYAGCSEGGSAPPSLPSLPNTDNIPYY